MYPNQLSSGLRPAMDAELNASPEAMKHAEEERQRWERIHERRAALERLWSCIANTQDAELLNRAVQALRPLAVEALERL